MPVQPSTKHFINFVSGLHSDATPLNHPENFTLDERNMVLNRDGSRERRPALKFEANGTARSVTGFTEPGDNNYAHRTFRWDNVATDPDLTLHVLQTGKLLWFFKEDTSDLTEFVPVGYYDLNINKFNSATTVVPYRSKLSFTTHKGALIMTGEQQHPVVIRYSTSTTPNITGRAVHIQFRDFTGKQVGTGYTTQPAALSVNHQYDLYNQGWSDAAITAYNTDPANTGNLYPANNEIPWMGYIPADTASATPKAFSYTQMRNNVQTNTQAPRGALLANMGMYNQRSSRSTRGTNFGVITNITEIVTNVTYEFTSQEPHNLSVSDVVLVSGGCVNYLNGLSLDVTSVIDHQLTVSSVPTTTTFQCALSFVDFGSAFAFTRNCFFYQYESVASIQNAKFDAPAASTETYLPSTCSAYAGRIFWGPPKTSKEFFEGVVFFSKVIQDDFDYGECFQENDPTAEIANQLLPTDGGQLTIAGLGTVIEMESLSSSLLIYAENGVWEINGGQQGIFTPTGFQVRKISNIKVLSERSIVEAEDTHYFWAKDGIYFIREGERDLNGFLRVQSLTANRIQKFLTDGNFIDLPTDDDLGIEGAYDDVAKQVVWATTQSAAGFAPRYNGLVRYDIILDAFTVFDWDTSAEPDKNVMAITALRTNVNANNERLKLWIFDNTIAVPDLRCMDFRPTSVNEYLDFGGDGDIENERTAYLVTGYAIEGAPHLRKSGTFITTYLERIEQTFVDDGSGGAVPQLEGGCLLYVRWEWADSEGAGGKWQTARQVYKFRKSYFPPTGIGDPYDDGYPVLATKTKIRGKGRAMQLRYESEETKAMKLYGWTSSLLIKLEE